MKLHRTERDYYAITIELDGPTPTLTGQWQASFDEGETWVNGAQVGEVWTWLVAGPDFDATAVGQDPADTQAVITKPTQPWLRLADNPVLKVEDNDNPWITFA